MSDKPPSRRNKPPRKDLRRGARPRQAPRGRSESQGAAQGEVQGERLQRIISRAGRASRRKAEELILAGRVTVNGRKAELGQRALPEDDVRVDGKQIGRASCRERGEGRV